MCSFCGLMEYAVVWRVFLWSDLYALYVGLRSSFIILEGGMKAYSEVQYARVS